MPDERGLLALLNALALATGVAYAVLAARRNRLCWIAGAISSACAAFLSAINKLPMQAALQVFYVGMSAFGWWSWVRSSTQGELKLSAWPVGWHVMAGVALVGISLISAWWLAPGQAAAWPLLDSLTTWFSLLATWLAARAKLENWLYWIIINGVMVFLFYEQQVWGMSLLSLVLVGIAAAGYIAWRRKYQAQEVPA